LPKKNAGPTFEAGRSTCRYEQHVDFAALANDIDTAGQRPSRAKGARSPYPTVLMTKILIL
jgi:hypothetical protein